MNLTKTFINGDYVGMYTNKDLIELEHEAERSASLAHSKFPDSHIIYMLREYKENSSEVECVRAYINSPMAILTENKFYFLTDILSKHCLIKALHPKSCI